jgi:DNA-binding NarL/FixJ family response regulator
MAEPQVPPTTPIILVVDDDHLVRRSLVRALERQGFEVRAACDVATSAEILKREPRVAGAILDYHLPDGTGLDVLENLIAVQPRPVLIMSGEASHQAINGAARRRAGFLLKPASASDLQPFLRDVEEFQALHGVAWSTLDDLFARFRLTPRQQDVVRLLVLEELTYSEVGERLGIKRTTVITHARAAEAELRCSIEHVRRRNRSLRRSS